MYGRDRYGGPQRQYTNMYYITAFYILVHKHIHWPCEYIYQYNKIYTIATMFSIYTLSDLGDLSNLGPVAQSMVSVNQRLIQ